MRSKYRYIQKHIPVAKWLVVSQQDDTKKLDWNEDWSKIFKIIDKNGGISQSDNGYNGWLMFEDDEDAQVCKKLIEEAGYKVEEEQPVEGDVIIKYTAINLCAFPRRFGFKG